MGVKKIRGKRIWIPIVIIILTIVAISLIAVITVIEMENYITYSIVDNNSNSVEESVAKNADVILVNSIVLGGVNNNKWVSANKIYDNKLKTADGIPVSMYSIDGQLGNYSTSVFRKKGDTYFTMTTKVDITEFVAVETTNTNASNTTATAVTLTSSEEAIAKKALGKYRLLNNSMQIRAAYQVILKEQEQGKLVFVTSKHAGLFGVYSAVIYISASNATLVKYSYVKNTDLSSNWPVYSLCSVLDITKDNNNEFIIQEITANNARYTLMEYDEKLKGFAERISCQISLQE